MNDVRGVEIKEGDTVLFVHHNSGIFSEGIVTGFGKTNVNLLIVMPEWYNGPIRTTKKDPKFIVVK